MLQLLPFLSPVTWWTLPNPDDRLDLAERMAATPSLSTLHTKIEYMFAVGLGLLLGTEAPIMTPHGVHFSSLSFSLLWPLVELNLGGI